MMLETMYEDEITKITSVSNMWDSTYLLLQYMNQQLNITKLEL